MKSNPKKPNLQHKKTILDNYIVLSKDFINDKRLTLQDKGAFLMILTFQNIYFSTNTTNKILNINEKTFKNIVNNLIKCGYIERIKKSNKEYEYITNQNGTPETFDHKNIQYYTLNQLKQYLYNTKTPKKYLNLIKKQIEYIKDIQNQIKDFEKEEKNETIENELPF